MLRVLMVVTALAVPVTAGGAIAQAAPAPEPPSSCQSFLTKRAYVSGFRSGESLVQQAYNSVNDCSLIDEFLDIVLNDVDRLTLPTGASDYLVCRFGGIIDGVVEKAFELVGECENQCFMDGAVLGEISADAYCLLSIALDGLDTADEFIRGAVATCGFAFELGCDASFTSVTRSYVDDFGFSCVEYTEGEHAEVWTQWRINQCAFDPEEPEDPIAESQADEEGLDSPL